MDPTLHRHSAIPIRTVPSTWGWFVKAGAKLWLRDKGQNTWPAGSGSMVRYVGGGNFNTLEGYHRAPRPWEYDDQGNVLIPGDYVEILFLDGNFKTPYVRPGIRPLEPDDADFFPGNPIGSDPNPIRARYTARNASGAVTGTLQVQALDGGNSFELVVGGAQFGEGVRVLLDYDAGQVRVEADEMVMKTAALEVYEATNALVSPALVDGLAAVSFHTKLAASLTEIAAKLAVLHGPSPATLELVTLLAAGTYQSARLNTE